MITTEAGPISLDVWHAALQTNTILIFKETWNFQLMSAYILCYGFLFSCDELSVLLRFLLKAELLLHAAGVQSLPPCSSIPGSFSAHCAPSLSW